MVVGGSLGSVAVNDAGLAIAMAAIILTIVIWALKIFVGNLLEVGGKRFFVLNKTENPTVGTTLQNQDGRHRRRLQSLQLL